MFMFMFMFVLCVIKNLNVSLSKCFGCTPPPPTFCDGAVSALDVYHRALSTVSTPSEVELSSEDLGLVVCVYCGGTVRCSVACRDCKMQSQLRVQYGALCGVCAGVLCANLHVSLCLSQPRLIKIHISPPPLFLYIPTAGGITLQPSPFITLLFTKTLSPTLFTPFQNRFLKCRR